MLLHDLQQRERLVYGSLLQTSWAVLSDASMARSYVTTTHILVVQVIIGLKITSIWPSRREDCKLLVDKELPLLYVSLLEERPVIIAIVLAGTTQIPHDGWSG